MINWVKKIHTESSLPKKEGQFAMFVGRWQPLHKGHQELFKQAMASGLRNVISMWKSMNFFKDSIAVSFEF